MMNRKIIEYYTACTTSKGTEIDDIVNNLIASGRQPLGCLNTLMVRDVVIFYQTMVKYAPLPDSVQLSVKYCQSNGVVGMSKPAVYTCKDCGQQRRGGQTTPVCHRLSGKDKND